MTIQRRILAGHLAFTCLLLGLALVALSAFKDAATDRAGALNSDPGIQEAQLLRLQLDALQRWMEIRETLPVDDIEDPAFQVKERERLTSEMVGAKATYRSLSLKLRGFKEGFSLGEPPACPSLDALLGTGSELGGEGKTAGPSPERGTGSVPDRQAGSSPERGVGSVPDRQAGSSPERGVGSNLQRGARSAPERGAGSSPEAASGSGSEGGSGSATAGDISPGDLGNGWPTAAMIRKAIPELAAVYEYVGQAQRNKIALVDEKNRRAETFVLIVVLVTLPLAAASSLLAIQWTIEPIHRLMIATEEIAEGKLAVRLPVAGDDEFARLSLAFNRMSDDLSRARKRESDFLAVATHELKTPLACIKAYAGTVRKELLPGGLGSAASEYLSRIDDEVVNLTGKVSKLLDLGVIEAGQLKLRKREFMTQGFLLMAAGAFRPIATQRRIEYEIDVNPSVPEMINADPDRLRQVLANVLDNAFKYTPSGGQVRFIARPVSGLLEIEVGDTGPGIPPELLRSIFEKYARVRSEPGMERAGTGLGLAVARGIVAAHDGTIEARSAPGQGSLFLIRLPVGPLTGSAAQDGNERSSENPV